MTTAAVLAPNEPERAAGQLGNCRAESVWHDTVADPRQRRDSVLLYFHGGGYVGGGLNTHRRLVAKFAHASRMPVFIVDNRHLPKAHFTETLDDAVEWYRYLLEQGFPADRIIVSGDSAGGGLTFRLAPATRERGLPMRGARAVVYHLVHFHHRGITDTFRRILAKSRLDRSIHGVQQPIPAVAAAARRPPRPHCDPAMRGRHQTRVSTSRRPCRSDYGSQRAAIARALTGAQ